MTRAIHTVSFMTAWNKPADDWARAKAQEMLRDGYSDGVIIARLEAYGIGLYAAQALVRNAGKGDPA